MACMLKGHMYIQDLRILTLSAKRGAARSKFSSQENILIVAQALNLPSSACRARSEIDDAFAH